MDKPTGLRPLQLLVDGSATDVCELAKGAFNSARRGKQAYRALVFILAVVLVMAVIYAIVAFKDERTARGFLALVTAAGTLATTGVLGVLARHAGNDEKAMWRRVEKHCD